MDRFGVDNPDVRFGLELKDVTGLVAGSGFKVFRDAVEKGGVVKAISVNGGAEFSRKDLDELAGVATSFGAKRLARVKVTDAGWQSPIEKFLSEKEKEGIAAALQAGAGDLILFVADRTSIANTALGRLRTALGRRLGLVPKGGFSFTW